MALIGTIRKNSWLLVVLIGFALAAFIIMDMTANRTGAPTDFTIGEINGDKISWPEFQQTESVLYANTNTEVFGRRSYLWNYFVEKTLVEQQAEDLGLAVADEELAELQFGNRVSPVVQRNFTDQTTGQFDRNSLNEFKRALDAGQLAPNYQQFWEMQSKEIVKDRLQSKLNGMVKQAIYTPTWMAEQAQKDMGSSLDFAFVRIPFSAIEDDAVTLEDADYAAYLSDKKALFTVDEEIRTIDYIEYNVVPTDVDSQNIKQTIAELIPAFIETEDDSQFVENNFGTIDVTYFKPEQLSPVISDSIRNLAIGSVYGPYIDEGAYKAVKVLDKKVIADSVKSRHILIRVETAEQFAAAQATIDSVKNLIETGVEPFDSLAIKVSQDIGSGAKGGDLGFAYPGMMVKPFNDMIFYQAEPGELNVVYTQFGIHLVEVTDRKFLNQDQGVQLAFIQEPIIPSEMTQDLLYDQALDFIATHRTLDELNAAIEENPEMELLTAEGITKNAHIFGPLGPGSTSRDIIRWAFDPGTKNGDVSPEVFVYEDEELYYNSKYVIPALRSTTAPGVPSVDDIKNTIQLAVMNEKKGEMIKSQISGTDMSLIAQQFETEVDTAENVNFNMSYLQALGQEPEVLAHLDALEINEVAGPIAGNNGVYMVKLIDKSIASLPTDIANLRNQVASPVRSAADFQLIEAMKKAAKIEDNRFTYY